MKKYLSCILIIIILLAGCGDKNIDVDKMNEPVITETPDNSESIDKNDNNTEIKENVLLPEEYKNWDESTYVEMSMNEKTLIYLDYYGSPTENIERGLLTGEQKEALDMLRTLEDYLYSVYPNEHFIFVDYKNISNNSEDRSAGADLTFYSYNYLGFNGLPKEFSANISADWVCTDNFYEVMVEPLFHQVFTETLEAENLAMDGTVVDIRFIEKIPTDIEEEIDINYIIKNYPKSEKFIYMFVAGIKDVDTYMMAFYDFVHNYNYCGYYKIYLVNELPLVDETGHIEEITTAETQYFTTKFIDCEYYGEENTDFIVYTPH